MKEDEPEIFLTSCSSKALCPGQVYMDCLLPVFTSKQILLSFYLFIAVQFEFDALISKLQIIHKIYNKKGVSILLERSHKESINLTKL